MTRYPDTLIETIRERIDLLELIGRYVKLKKNGANWLGLCPFHNEKTPSFNVRPDKGFYKCFGCGKGGDAFDFLLKIKGVDFYEAIEELAGMAGVPLPKPAKESPAQTQEKQKREKQREHMTAALTFFKQKLRSPQGAAALGYLTERGLTAETIERFQIGYAPPGWSNLLDHFGAQESVAKDLEEIGLVTGKQDGGKKYDRFRDRIIFPIFNLKGKCVAFGGRVLGSGLPKYINSPETPLYRKGDILYGLDKTQEAIQREGQLLVVEGYMDLIALANHGIDHVVATLGTSLTQNHLRLIWRRTKRVVFCFDGDRAGEDAAWRALEMVIDGHQADRNAQFLFLGEKEDPDDVVRRDGADGFLRLAGRATSLIDFLIKRLGRDLDLKSPEGRAALVHRARPLLAKVGDPLLRELYADTLGQRFEIPLHRVMPAEAVAGPVPPMESYSMPMTWQRQGAAPRRVTRAGWPRKSSAAGFIGRDIEQLLLSLLIRNPSWIAEQEESLREIELENPQFSLLLTDLLEMEHELLEEEGFDLFTNLSSSQLLMTAQTILRSEEVVPESERDELIGCMTSLQIKRTKKELQQAIDRFGNDPANRQGSDKLIALRMELSRLQKSRVRSVQSH